ncbi:sulfurtransferase complex subunit TusC [Thalassotalea crassostreae]|uniref:sulfurtransferase complex subunit TusC n=1 Tax=Thalassotalea crassostreae TaxID=1763536 RepID=UPI000838D080|nr:sulfurtransferase complex subunit TusC [Thalassotalea crassostreae]
MSHVVKHYAIVNTRASFDALSAKEALDAALILASYEMQVSIYFMADGVYQTQDNQNPELISMKDFIATFKALGFYDIEDINVCKRSLETRNLAQDFSLEDVNVLDKNHFTEKLNQADIVLTF